MHIVLGVVGLAAAAYFLVQRARMGAEMATELVDVAQDVRAAARRFGFKRRTDIHPVESIDNPDLAIAGIASAFIALDDLPTAEDRQRLKIKLRQTLQASEDEASEMLILGQWFVETCQGATPAIARLSKHLYRLDDGACFETLMRVLQGVAADRLSRRQSEALDDIKRAFRLV
ncbi:MAG: hypothetical protein ACFB11_19620 [Paracoccaceae bacterium]